ncbi:MAG: O-antigen ligase family protein [Thermoleophilaceae bacterium]|nr:O-antigen ligase family protein [Thermoleophilaceae bacterium]
MAIVLSGALTVRSPEVAVALTGLLAIAAACAIYSPVSVTTWLLVVVLIFAAPTLDWPVPVMRLAWLLVGLCLLAIATSDRAAALVRSSPAAWLLLAVPGLGAAAHWSGVQSLREATYPFFVVAGCVVIATWCATERPALFARILRFLLWASVAMAVLAVVQRITGTWPVVDALTGDQYLGSAAYPGRSAAVFGHPIIYANFAQFCALVALLRRPRMWGVILAANFVGVLLSGSRSAWVGLGLGVILILGLQIARKLEGGSSTRQALAVLLGLTFLIAAALPQVTGPVATEIQERVRGENARVGVDARANRVRAGWDAIAHAGEPLVVAFGRGPGAGNRFWANAPQQADRGAPTFDNTYIAILFDFGVVGLGLVVLLCMAALIVMDWAGRVLLICLLWDIWSFVALNWPALLMMIGLAVGVGHSMGRGRSSAASSGAHSESVRLTGSA